jgi:hypothetical protein
MASCLQNLSDCDIVSSRIPGLDRGFLFVPRAFVGADEQREAAMQYA